MKTKARPNHTPAKSDYEFIARAERAFKKVGKQIRAEAKRDGTKPLVWKN